MKTDIAKTLSGILENPVVRTSLDRSQPIDGFVQEFGQHWAADLLNRRPAPAYTRDVDGRPIYQGTDLDLLTAMNALAQREAVINIPDYERMGRTRIRPDQRVISRRNRHGQVYGMISNAKVHSFSTRIKDYNVIQELLDGREEVGAFRNFALVDARGNMYKGWRTIEFKATDDERNFFEERGLYFVPGTIVVHNFVHPNLSNAFYGSPYFEAKTLSGRIKDEASFYRKLAKDLRKQGINLGAEDKPSVKSFPALGEDLEEIQVENLEAKLILPDMTGKYTIYGMNEHKKIKPYQRMPTSPKGKQSVLRYAEDRARKLSYTLGPKVNASVRAIELAFLKHGFKGGIAEYGNENYPGWDRPEFVREYKESPKARTEWNVLPYVTGKDDAIKAGLLYRIRETTTNVRA